VVERLGRACLEAMIVLPHRPLGWTGRDWSDAAGLAPLVHKARVALMRHTKIDGPKDENSQLPADDTHRGPDRSYLPRVC
jgi:hypothetical protein